MRLEPANASMMARNGMPGPAKMLLSLRHSLYLCLCLSSVSFAVCVNVPVPDLRLCLYV